MRELARQRAATVEVWRADVATRPEGRWSNLGGVAVHATGLAVRHWNGAHVTEPAGLGRLTDVHQWFGPLPYGVLVPAELSLEPSGMTHLLDQPVMLRSLRDLPPPPDLDLRWDRGADAVPVQLEAFGDPQTKAFVLPKVINPACALVVAYDGNRPVSTATLVVVDGVAAVFGVATLASHRRQGLGAAVTLAVLHEGVRRGCDLAYLNPSESGHAMYASLGFTDVLPWRVWVDEVATSP